VGYARTNNPTINECCNEHGGILNLKNNEEIKNVQVAKRIPRLSSSRCNITEQTETLLLVWINEKQMAGDSIRHEIICEKTKQLFEELGAKFPSTSVKDFALGCGTGTYHS